MALLIACFIIALFIYFAFYYEKDKETMKQRSKNKGRRNEGDCFILPFFEENQNGPQEDMAGSSDEVDDIFSEDH